MTRILTLLTLLALLAGPRFAGAAGEITLGVVNWIGYGPIYCAVAEGYYRQYGLDVKLATFSDNSLMPGAVEGGELDASTLTYDQVILADARGWKLKVVMPVDYSVGGDAILASAAVHAVGDLKGRRVAFQPMSPSDFLLGYALATAGLSERDVRPISSTPEGVAGIMATGLADAGVTYQPSVSMILRLGGGRQYHVLLSSRDARGMITDVLVLKSSTIVAKPRLVEGLIRGTLDGRAFMQKDPAEAASLIAKALDISPADVRSQLSNIENPSPAQLGDVFKKTDTLPSFYASGRIIEGILEKQGQLTALPRIDETYDASFAAAVQARAGEPR